MRLAAALTVTLAALALQGCEQKKPSEGATPTAGGGAGAGPAGGTILLGHVGSMTGNEATFGESTDRGVRLAVDEANARGGVKDRKLEVRTYDNQGRPEESANAAIRLITEDKVAVLIGEVASRRTLAMAPIADRYQVPLVSPSSTNPRVTKEGEKTRPYVFRVCFIDPFQGTVMAKFARENLKLERVAVMRDVGNDYSVGLADYFIATFRELGGKIVDDQSYKAGDQDFKAQLTTIKGKNPEAIYVPGYYTEVALMARQARELGIKVPLMGGDGWDSSKLFEIGGKALEGSYYSNHVAPDDPAPRIQEFVRKYREKWGAAPDGLAAQGYDAAQVVIDAMSRAPDLSGGAIRKALEDTKGFEGVTGTITINADHDAVKPAVVVQVTNDAAKFVARIEPDEKGGAAPQPSSQPAVAR
ncbi:MAG TPA: ABC transporter substrate-binding protein [Anaeromyxobacteraceae bacterium]|nr:ABC transporter substrate-binding protein [Anaeromyxobacteraceae bacterium]